MKQVIDTQCCVARVMKLADVKEAQSKLSGTVEVPDYDFRELYAEEYTGKFWMWYIDCRIDDNVVTRVNNYGNKFWMETVNYETGEVLYTPKLNGLKELFDLVENDLENREKFFKSNKQYHVLYSECMYGDKHGKSLWHCYNTLVNFLLRF